MNNGYTVYSLQISDKFQNYEEAYRLLRNFYGILDRLIQKPKYTNTSFIIGISETESDTAQVTFEKNGKRGRPKKIIVGDKTDWHFHIYIISDTDSVSSFCEEAKRLFLKKQKYAISKGKNDSLQNALEYLERQCLRGWKKGSYFHSRF